MSGGRGARRVDRVPAITSERLELVSLSPTFMEALLAGDRPQATALAGHALPDGWPDRHDGAFLRLRARQLRDDPGAQEWLVRGLVLREDGRPMVGHAGFHGPPGVNAVARPDAVELGYTIFPPYRGRGYASEAVRALIGWARGERGIRRFVASVAPDNAPSLAIVRKLGFVETGRHWDEEDGEELELQLELGDEPA
ncbi:MAG: GNAT family N-acetyltransferase [Thermoleophilia bacterium]|nr:GNAT family N-acetyltransferase [Thermoleophilia bacterium]